MSRAASRIDGQDEAESVLGPFSLSDYGSWWIPNVYDIRDLRLSTSDDDREGTVLELVMVRTPQTHLVRFRFTGIRQLFLGDRRENPGFLMHMAGFEIQDVSEHGWENVHWELGDFEENLIFGYADKASVSVEKLSLLDSTAH